MKPVELVKFILGIVGIVLAVILFVLSIATPVPPKEISSYKSVENGGYEEYINGDAYNYIIEASLRGGFISGAQTSKAVYLTGSFLLLIISASVLLSSQTLQVIAGAKEKTQKDIPQIPDTDHPFDSAPGPQVGEQSSEEKIL